MTEKEKVCFIVSPIGDIGTEARQKADDFLQFIVRECEAIIRYNYQVLRADEITEPGRITVQVIKYIDTADLVIADVTGGNLNVYYELALRHALGRPLITCAETGTLLPFDTKDNRTIFYSMHAREAKKARESLSQQIDSVNAGGFVPDNPIIGALEVIKLRGSNNSNERSLGQLIEKVDEMSGRLSALDQKVSQTTYFAALSTQPGASLGCVDGIPAMHF